MSESDCDVAIVGAGGAGLAAARTLARAGKRVTLLESRNRAGGRMYTRTHDGAGAPIEFGPEFVHGTPRVTLDALRESGDRVVDNGDESWTMRDGTLQRASDDEFEAAEKLLEAGMARDPDCTIDELLDDARARGADARVIERTRALVGGFDAADPARASARAIAIEWTGDASAEGAQSRPIRGYGRFVAFLVRSLDPARAIVQYSSIVSHIALHDDHVALRLRTHDVDRQVRARAAIVTVPLGVLQAPAEALGAITFLPPLPSAHVRALAALAMGPVLKVICHFATPFWETIRDGRYRNGAFFSTHGRFPTIWTQLPVRASTLTAWAGGPAAAVLAARSQDELVTIALDDIVALFDAPIARESLIAAHVHDWQRDPFSRGAYSYALVGANDARERLGDPIGRRLFIAGEATASGAEGGTVAGALESGERAARAVLATL